MIREYEEKILLDTWIKVLKQFPSKETNLRDLRIEKV